MARKKGAPDAAQKRSIARRFNDSLLEKAARAGHARTLDRRTVRRLERYRDELKKGKKVGDKLLTPLDVAMRVDELLGHGDKLAEIRKLTKPRQVEYDGDRLVSVLTEMHPIYQFRAEAYRFAGVKNEALVAAGVLPTMPARRGRPPRSGPPAARKAPRKKAPSRKGRR